MINGAYAYLMLVIKVLDEAVRVVMLGLVEGKEGREVTPIP